MRPAEKNGKGTINKGLGDERMGTREVKDAYERKDRLRIAMAAVEEGASVRYKLLRQSENGKYIVDR